MYIPKSTWVVKKEYFPVTLVDHFRMKYKLWFYAYEGIVEGDDFSESCTPNILEELNDFIENIVAQEVVELYEFPMKHNSFSDIDEPADYFEKLDDNFVIPRELFKIKGE